MINIIYEDNHILVVEKPINIPVQADSSKNIDFQTMLKKYLKEKYQKPGNVYLGIVHRLDRPVSGIMVFAKTSKAAKRLSDQIQNHQFEKKYIAVVEGKVKEKDSFEDYLYKDSAKNLVKVDPKGKYAKLSYQKIREYKNLSFVLISLETGRSHQIRVQFSSRGCPLYGDQRYNRNAKTGQQIALFASSISFYHPITKEKLQFSLPTPKRKPFFLFI